MKFKFDFNKIIGYFNLNSERGLFINSARDWKVLLLCSLFVLVAVSVFDIVVLMRVKGELNANTEIPNISREMKIDEQALNDVLKEIDRKAANFKSLP